MEPGNIEKNAVLSDDLLKDPEILNSVNAVKMGVFLLLIAVGVASLNEFLYRIFDFFHCICRRTEEENNNDEHNYYPNNTNEIQQSLINPTVVPNSFNPSTPDERFEPRPENEMYPVTENPGCVSLSVMRSADPVVSNRVDENVELLNLTFQEELPKPLYTDLPNSDITCQDVTSVQNSEDFDSSELDEMETRL